MNELLNVIGCCCPPPRHPFLLPSDTRGNASLPPRRAAFSILPRSGDDEIRLPQWRRWNTAPAYYYAIGNLSFLISLAPLSALPPPTDPPHIPPIAVSLSLFPPFPHTRVRERHSHSRPSSPPLPLLSACVRVRVCVCVTCFYLHTDTPPPAVLWQRQTPLVIYNRSPIASASWAAATPILQPLPAYTRSNGRGGARLERGEGREYIILSKVKRRAEVKTIFASIKFPERGVPLSPPSRRAAAECVFGRRDIIILPRSRTIDRRILLSPRERFRRGTASVPPLCTSYKIIITVVHRPTDCIIVNRLFYCVF